MGRWPSDDRKATADSQARAACIDPFSQCNLVFAGLGWDEVLILRGNTDNLRLVSGIAERSALAQGEALRCQDVQG